MKRGETQRGEERRRDETRRDAERRRDETRRDAEVTAENHGGKSREILSKRRGRQKHALKTTEEKEERCGGEGREESIKEKGDCRDNSRVVRKSRK